MKIPLFVSKQINEGKQICNWDCPFRDCMKQECRLFGEELNDKHMDALYCCESCLEIEIEE